MIRADTRPIVLALAPAGALWQVALVLGASAFLAVAARFEIPLPPVPVTGQTFAVLIVGATLGARLGGAGVVAYLAEEAFGLPVLPGSAAGLARLSGRPAATSPASLPRR